MANLHPSDPTLESVREPHFAPREKPSGVRRAAREPDAAVLDRIHAACRRDGIVDYLRERLAEANRGEITGLAVVLERSDGSTEGRFFVEPGSFPMKIAGELDHLKYLLHDHESARSERRGSR